MTVVASYIYRAGKRAEDVPLKDPPSRNRRQRIRLDRTAEPTAQEMASLKDMFGLHSLAIDELQ